MDYSYIWITPEEAKAARIVIEKGETSIKYKDARRSLKAAYNRLKDVPTKLPEDAKSYQLVCTKREHELIEAALEQARDWEMI